jgi:hypothetical protein
MEGVRRFLRNNALPFHQLTPTLGSYPRSGIGATTVRPPTMRQGVQSDTGRERSFRLYLLMLVITVLDSDGEMFTDPINRLARYVVRPVGYSGKLHVDLYGVAWIVQIRCDG